MERSSTAIKINSSNLYTIYILFCKKKNNILPFVPKIHLWNMEFMSHDEASMIYSITNLNKPASLVSLDSLHNVYLLFPRHYRQEKISIYYHTVPANLTVKTENIWKE